jgi:hypothetical protein
MPENDRPPEGPEEQRPSERSKKHRRGPQGPDSTPVTGADLAGDESESGSAETVSEPAEVVHAAVREAKLVPLQEELPVHKKEKAPAKPAVEVPPELSISKSQAARMRFRRNAHRRR